MAEVATNQPVSEPVAATAAGEAPTKEADAYPVEAEKKDTPAAAPAKVDADGEAAKAEATKGPVDGEGTGGDKEREAAATKLQSAKRGKDARTQVQQKRTTSKDSIDVPSGSAPKKEGDEEMEDMSSRDGEEPDKNDAELMAKLQQEEEEKIATFNRGPRRSSVLDDIMGMLDVAKVSAGAASGAPEGASGTR